MLPAEKMSRSSSESSCDSYESDGKGLAQGLRKNGFLHGLGRETCGLETQVGIFEAGQLTRGYKCVQHTISLGDYSPQGLLTGRGFRLGVNGILTLGDFKDGVLHGIGLLKTPEMFSFGHFVGGALYYGVQCIGESMYCGGFDGLAPHGLGTRFEPFLATKGNWTRGELAEIHAVDRVATSLPTSLTTLELEEAFQLLLLVLAENCNNVEISYTRLVHVRHCVLAVLRSYPTYHDHTCWNYPAKHYDNVHFYPDGSAYSAPTTGGKKGVYLYPPQHRFSHFVGKLENGQLDGSGLLYTSAGDRISATWRSGALADKKGSIRYRNRDKFTGLIDDDMYPRSGALLSPSGRIFKGEFKGNKMDGHGILICRTGAVIEGTWLDGNLEGPNIRVYRPGQWTGILTYSAGTPTGSGFILTSSGLLLYTTFQQGAVIRQEAKWDTAMSSSINEVRKLLACSANKIQVEHCKPVDKPDLFKVNVTFTSDTALSVDVDYQLEPTARSINGYFVRISANSESLAYSKLVKSDSKQFVVKGLQPGAHYSVLAGVIRRRNLIPLRKLTAVATFNGFPPIHNLDELRPEEIREAMAGSSKAKLYNMNEFPQFVEDAHKYRDYKLGYDERTATFIIMST